MEPQGTTWNHKGRHGTTRDDMEPQGTTWNDKGRHGTTREYTLLQISLDIDDRRRQEYILMHTKHNKNDNRRQGKTRRECTA
eukprot:scaffold34604_cov164-Amphora_coffeaeformis.AAC.6